MTHYFLFGKTDQGLHRKKNEDTILVNEDKGFCLVADGIGGTAAGDVASQLFARTASDVFSMEQNPDGRESERVKKTFLIANDNILKYAKNNSACEGMGCTAELLALSDKQYVLGHMGDSRAYRLRRGNLKQLTTDHSLVQEQLEQGMITSEPPWAEPLAMGEVNSVRPNTRNSPGPMEPSRSTIPSTVRFNSTGAVWLTAELTTRFTSRPAVNRTSTRRTP